MLQRFTILISLLACVLLASGTVFGHSVLYPDAFYYDPSGENRLIPLDRALTERRAAQTCDSVSTPSVITQGSGQFLCHNVDLHSVVLKSEMGGNNSNLNDIWGWTDILTGMEIAIVGRTNGTSFVDISDPDNPLYLGFLPSHNGGSASWRDIKVYADHAFIVADGSSNATHGLQVFDLTALRTVTPGATLTETAHFGGFGAAHNIAINEDSGFAYVLGSNQCSGGLYMVDISSPTQPSFAGCFSADGYSHDAQCVTYAGPDSRYTGQEICAAYNEDTLTLVDVTVKTNPVMLSAVTYAGAQYTHQGWFLDDNHTYIVLDDELDESASGNNTQTYMFDVSLLDAPVQMNSYVGPTKAIDHNLYTRDGYVFESNYRSGLSILDANNVGVEPLREVAFFDTILCSDTPQFSGFWSSYIYFPSGTVVSSDIGYGMFVLSPDWNAINDPNNVVNMPHTLPASCTPDPPPSPPPPRSGGGGGGGGGGTTEFRDLVLLLLVLVTINISRIRMRKSRA